MASYYLVNCVKVGTSQVYAGSKLTDGIDDVAGVQASGGRLVVSTNVAVTAAALIATSARQRGASNQELDSIMGAAAGAGFDTVSNAVTGLAAVAFVQHEIFKLPDATATVLSTTTAKAASQPKAPSAQPNCPRNVQLVTAGGWASTGSVAVTLTGITTRGISETEVLTIVSAGTTVESSKAWITSPTITSWTTPAGWTAGTFQMKAGTKLGLISPAGATVAILKEVGYTDATPTVAAAAAGTIDATNSTYVPTTALDGANDVEVWYATTIADAGHVHALT